LYLILRKSGGWGQSRGFGPRRESMQGIAVVLDLLERLQNQEWENASLRARL
jgi:hypothetical protein